MSMWNRRFHHQTWRLEVSSEMSRLNQSILVGGLEHFLFSHILGIIIPIDYYFSEGFKPPTRNCCSSSFVALPAFFFWKNTPFGPYVSFLRHVHPGPQKGHWYQVKTPRRCRKVWNQEDRSMFFPSSFPSFQSFLASSWVYCIANVQQKVHWLLFSSIFNINGDVSENVSLWLMDVNGSYVCLLATYLSCARREISSVSDIPDMLRPHIITSRCGRSTAG